MAFKDEIVIRKYEDTNIMTIPEHIEYISQTIIVFHLEQTLIAKDISFNSIQFYYICLYSYIP